MPRKYKRYSQEEEEDPDKFLIARLLDREGFAPYCLYATTRVSPSYAICSNCIEALRKCLKVAGDNQDLKRYIDLCLEKYGAESSQEKAAKK